MHEKIEISDGERFMVKLSAFERRLDKIRTLSIYDPEYNKTYMILALLATSMGSKTIKRLADTFEPLSPILK